MPSNTKTICTKRKLIIICHFLFIPPEKSMVSQSNVFLYQDLHPISVTASYRVSRYSCHLLISLCARMEKKQSPDLANLRNDRVQDLPPQKTCHPLPKTCHPQSSGLYQFLGVASPGLCHLWGWPV